MIFLKYARITKLVPDAYVSSEVSSESGQMRNLSRAVTAAGRVGIQSILIKKNNLSIRYSACVCRTLLLPFELFLLLFPR